MGGRVIVVVTMTRRPPGQRQRPLQLATTTILLISMFLSFLRTSSGFTTTTTRLVVVVRHFSLAVPATAGPTSTTLTRRWLVPSSRPIGSSLSRRGTTAATHSIDRFRPRQSIHRDLLVHMSTTTSTTTTTTTNYIFGYGSLICPYSRSLTAPEQASQVATPVVVQGVQRMWSKRTNRGMTAMGIRLVPPPRPSENNDDDESSSSTTTTTATTARLGSAASSSTTAQCVGVLLPVQERDLAAFDEREMGYTRKELDLDAVHVVPFLEQEDFYERHEAHEIFLRIKDEKQDTDNVKLWIYEQQQPRPPTPQHPIVQSYLDVILRGCLTISEEFAAEFLETTIGWHPDDLIDYVQDDEYYAGHATTGPDESTSIWLDDRHAPIYPRGDPLYSRRQAQDLDRLLQRYRPRDFARRQLLIAPAKQ